MRSSTISMNPCPTTASLMTAVLGPKVEVESFLQGDGPKSLICTVRRPEPRANTWTSMGRMWITCRIGTLFSFVLNSRGNPKPIIKWIICNRVTCRRCAYMHACVCGIYLSLKLNVGTTGQTLPWNPGHGDQPELDVDSQKLECQATHMMFSRIVHWFQKDIMLIGATLLMWPGACQRQRSTLGSLSHPRSRVFWKMARCNEGLTCQHVPYSSPMAGLLGRL